MSFLKRIGAYSLICAFMLNLLPIHLVTYAANEDFAYVVTHFKKYDEATHEILDDDIDSAEAGDVIAVTFAIKNNTDSNATIVIWRQFIRFNAEFLRVPVAVIVAYPHAHKALLIHRVALQFEISIGR